MLNLERQRPHVGERVERVLHGGDVELWQDLGLFGGADGELEGGEELRGRESRKRGKSVSQVRERLVEKEGSSRFRLQVKRDA